MATVTHVLERPSHPSKRQSVVRAHAAPRIWRDVQEVLSVRSGCADRRSPARRDRRGRNRILFAIPHRLSLAGTTPAGLRLIAHKRRPISKEPTPRPGSPLAHTLPPTYVLDRRRSLARPGGRLSVTFRYFAGNSAVSSPWACSRSRLMSQQAKSAPG